jgi:release factor glutamine methyltransferase
VALTAAGIDTPRLDAEVLLAHAMGTDRLALLTDRDAVVEGPAIRVFQDAVRRRAVGREPVAYITGVKGFRHLDIAVDPRVLIPRPETETLVEAAMEALPQGARVVDVGTGSGAIALALKDERPDLDVVATDVSEDALAVARANAERLALDVAFAQADLLAGVGSFDAVVSNPPYVEDAAELAAEIVRHEPSLALRAGPDGLDVLRALVPAAAAMSAEILAVEVGAGQAGAVERLARDAGFTRTERRADLAGVDRVVVAWR